MASQIRDPRVEAADVPLLNGHTAKLPSEHVCLYLNSWLLSTFGGEASFGSGQKSVHRHGTGQSTRSKRLWVFFTMTFMSTSFPPTPKIQGISKRTKKEG